MNETGGAHVVPEVNLKALPFLDFPLRIWYTVSNPNNSKEDDYNASDFQSRQRPFF